jgi:hypothetical protein
VSGWQARADAARQNLAAAEARAAEARARADDARQRLNPMSASYANDTNNGDTGTLMRLQGEVTEAEANLKDAEAALKAARQAWDSFEAEARAGGAPPEVLKPPSPPR